MLSAYPSVQLSAAKGLAGADTACAMYLNGLEQEHCAACNSWSEQYYYSLILNDESLETHAWEDKFGIKVD